jgi:O-6-methylguanine DNA methyltransferase
MIYAHAFTTPVGDMLALVNESGAVVRLEFLREGSGRPQAPAGDTPRPPARDLARSVAGDPARTVADAVARETGQAIEWDAGACRGVVEQLDEYFRGRRRDFDLELSPRGTEFQLRVWRELTRIPYGETISYQELSRRIGNPSATRAVGRANGANPIPIVIPCHRVIGADGSLTGYGGGIDIKRQLLALEGVRLGGEQLPLVRARGA